MNKYEVVDSSITIHPGVNVMLDPAQFRRRKHLVRVIKEYKKGDNVEKVLVEVLSSVQFKFGEILECNAELNEKKPSVKLLNGAELKKKKDEEKTAEEKTAKEKVELKKAQESEDDELLKQLDEEDKKEENLFEELDKVDEEDEGLLLDLLGEKE